MDLFIKGRKKKFLINLHNYQSLIPITLNLFDFIRLINLRVVKKILKEILKFEGKKEIKNI